MGLKTESEEYFRLRGSGVLGLLLSSDICLSFLHVLNACTISTLRVDLMDESHSDLCSSPSAPSVYLNIYKNGIKSSPGPMIYQKTKSEYVLPCWGPRRNQGCPDRRWTHEEGGGAFKLNSRNNIEKPTKIWTWTHKNLVAARKSGHEIFPSEDLDIDTFVWFGLHIPVSVWHLNLGPTSQISDYSMYTWTSCSQTRKKLASRMGDRNQLSANEQGTEEQGTSCSPGITIQFFAPFIFTPFILFQLNFYKSNFCLISNAHWQILSDFFFFSFGWL